MADEQEGRLTDLRGPLSRVVSGYVSQAVEDARRGLKDAERALDALLSERIIDNGLRSLLRQQSNRIMALEEELAKIHENVRERFGPATEDWMREMDELIV